MAFDKEIFFKLLDSAKEQEDCQLDNFAITLKIDGWVIECYKDYYDEENPILTIEDCGSFVFGVYDSETLTDEQYDLLNKKFDKMREAWLNRYEEKNKQDNDFNGDYYEYYGVNRAMFI